MKDGFMTASVAVMLCICLSSCAGTAGGGISADSQDEVNADAGDKAFSVSYPGVGDISSPSVRVEEIPIREGYWSCDVGGKGKNVYFVRTNVSSSVIDRSYVQNVSGSSGFASSLGRSALSDSSFSVSQEFYSDDSRRHVRLKPNAFSRSVSRAGIIPYRSRGWNIGDERELWLEDGKGNYQRKTVRLYARNYNCYVWCVPDEATSFTKLKDLASIFDSVCQPVIYLSGSPSSQIFGSLEGNSLGKVSMDGFSMTGSMVNIVVYDIGNDGENGSYIGFFASRDYYPNKEDLSLIADNLTYGDGDRDLNYSNEGQFIYLDSWYLRNRFGTALSTLVHEFHHLIVWGQKYMSNGKLIGNQWNELLSMMCEDLLQEKISLEDSSFSFWDSPAQRLPYFEACYANTGLEIRADSNNGTVMSYSYLYAFGAWLLRNFGGAELFARMARSEYINEDMVIEAVNSVNGTSYSMENLLGMFAVSCIARDYKFTMNQDARQTRTHALTGYGFPSPAIDLWNLDSSRIKGINSSYAFFDGCGFIGANESESLRPYGMLLSYVGKTSGSVVSLYFGKAAVSSNMRMYAVITD